MITTARNKFVGFHVTADVQQLLRREARRRQLSVSRLVFQLTVEGLQREGYTITDEPATSVFTQQDQVSDNRCEV